MDYRYLPNCMGHTGYYQQKVEFIMLELIDYQVGNRSKTNNRRKEGWEHARKRWNWTSRKWTT